jgi:hypothetical protein
MWSVNSTEFTPLTLPSPTGKGKHEYALSRWERVGVRDKNTIKRRNTELA